MRKYEKYKDSRVEWIGEVPEHWEITRLKNITKLYGRIGFRGYTQNDLVPKSEGAITLSPSNMKNGTMDYSKCSYLTWAKYYESPEIIIRNEDVLFVKTGSTYGKVSYVSGLPMQSTINPQIVVFKEVRCNRKFLFYLLINNVIQDQVAFTVGGSTIPTLSQENILNYSFALPKIIEQESIASYLDSKIGEIDGMIEKTEKKIKLYEELKKSIITHAVTKGLNPNAKMKDSGVEWIGEVPEHWNKCRLKFNCCLKGRIGWNGLRSDEFETDSYAYLVTGQDFKSSDIEWSKCYQINKNRYEEDPFIQLKNGDLLITKDGTIGKIAKVSNMDKSACLNSGIFVMKQKSKKNEFTQGFLYWLLCSDLFKAFNQYTTTGTTILHLYQNVFENMPLLIPSLPEQQSIASYLDSKTSTIDSQISIAHKRIDLLKELKSSLITNVVTGKIKVC